VGGDFYDYLPINENRFALVIADASGKGMPAALLISQIQAILKSDVRYGSPIRQTMANLNKHLKRYSSAQNFATLFYGVIDLGKGTCEFANAGHNYPFLIKNNGNMKLLKTTGPALGIMQNGDHETETIRVSSGDCLLLYTDGITETMTTESTEYGEQRLQQILQRNRDAGAQKILDAIIDDLSAFDADDALQDDRTIVVLKVFGNTGDTD
ncbi:MAG: PP2C family protein-serine/threonine phosphatase, partial [bacterium]